MIYGLYNSAAGMMTNEYRQAVLANNLANAETVGFKRDVAIMAERLPAAQAGQREGPSDPSLAGLTGGLWLGRTYTDFSDGAKVPTENPLDVALDGPGFLAVSDGGQTLFTRDGRLMVDRLGLLVAVSDGAAVLGQGGAPIHVNPLGGPVSIDDYGHVQQDGARVGELAIVDFDDYDALQKVGDGRIAAPEGVAARPGAALLQAGYTESSSVEPLIELVNMIEASRAYQMNAQMVSLQDQTLGRLIAVINR